MITGRLTETTFPQMGAFRGPSLCGCIYLSAWRGFAGEGDAMTENFEFARFRQHLRTRPQRQLLGINMNQEETLQLLGDEAALRAEYHAWRQRNGLPEPECHDVTTDAYQPTQRTLWDRLRGR